MILNVELGLYVFYIGRFLLYIFGEIFWKFVGLKFGWLDIFKILLFLGFIVIVIILLGL